MKLCRLFIDHIEEGFTESISEAKEFNNEQEMKEFIVKSWDNFFDINDIVIDGEPNI